MSKQVSKFIDKMNKNGKTSRFWKKEVIRVFHIKSMKKRGKIVGTAKLSTLSTQKQAFLVDNSAKKKNERFVKN